MFARKLEVYVLPWIYSCTLNSTLYMWISCYNQWILEVWLDYLKHYEWLFIDDAWSILPLEVIMAWKREQFWVKALENVDNIFLIGIAFLNLSLSACIRTWSPSHIPFSWVNFICIALIACKLVALHFVVIYYVGLDINIPHYTRMCITMLCSRRAATISTPA